MWNSQKVVHCGKTEILKKSETLGLLSVINRFDKECDLQKSFINCKLRIFNKA